MNPPPRSSLPASPAPTPTPSAGAASSPSPAPSAHMLERRGSHSSIQPHRLPVSIRQNHPTLYISGRPPWYSKDGSIVKDAFIIGCAGGSASGKTTVAEKIIQQLGVPWVVLLSMDSFYKDLTPEQLELAHKNEYNFDHPNSFDFDLLYKTLKDLKAGKQVEIPQYDFTTHKRMAETRTTYGASVIFFEGIFALYDQRILGLMDMKIFVDTDDDIRLARRLDRDIAVRKRDLKGVLQQYSRFVKPAFDQYIRPSLAKADVIIPRGGDNVVAIDLISQNIRHRLVQRGVAIRSQLLESDDNITLSPNVKVLRPTSQLKVIHTIIRDVKSPRDDFIFYSQRLFRILLEEALTELSFEHKAVTTPTESRYNGRAMNAQVCGVSIIRAGGALEGAFQHIQKDVSIGKLLIQTDMKTGEPQLHYFNLPKSISACKVILMDATIATGAAAIMAIRVLLDHGVQQENIVFVTTIATKQGLNATLYAFPRIKIVVSEIDDGVNDQYHIIPGIGNFGDRYYGTDFAPTEREEPPKKKRKGE